MNALIMCCYIFFIIIQIDTIMNQCLSKGGKSCFSLDLISLFCCPAVSILLQCIRFHLYLFYCLLSVLNLLLNLMLSGLSMFILCWYVFISLFLPVSSKLYYCCVKIIKCTIIIVPTSDTFILIIIVSSS